MRLVLALGFIVLLNSCVTRPFVPVNVGREYGNPTNPWFVSHLPEKNKWALARTKPHTLLQRIICFHYPCRKMIGRRKTLRAISMKDFKKRIAKNARKGVYDKVNPKPRPVTPKTDTIIKKKPVIAARPKPKDKALEVKAIQGLDVKVAPVLRRDSLITLGGEFLFAVNSYNLKTEHFTQLDSLSKFLLAHPTLEVSISGHTDNTGDEKHNVTLSAKRAEGVAQYLINKGVSDERVFFEGFGSSKPIRENDTPEGRGKNRRVEILIREPKK